MGLIKTIISKIKVIIIITVGHIKNKTPHLVMVKIIVNFLRAGSTHRYIMVNQIYKGLILVDLVI